MTTQHPTSCKLEGGAVVVAQLAELWRQTEARGSNPVMKFLIWNIYLLPTELKRRK